MSSEVAASIARILVATRELLRERSARRAFVLGVLLAGAVVVLVQVSDHVSMGRVTLTPEARATEHRTRGWIDERLHLHLRRAYVDAVAERRR